MAFNEPEPNRRDLWLMRVFYFASMGGAGFIGPFLNLFFTRQGLSGTQIGLMAALGSVIAMIAAPLWTSESTRRGIVRQSLQVSLALSAVCYLWLGGQSLFFWILVANTLRILVSAGANPLSDSLAVSVTGATRAGFGSIRVWASFGWAVVVLFSGWLIQHTGMTSGFIGTGVMLGLSCGLLFWVRPGLFKPADPSKGPRPALHQVALDMLRNPAMISVGLMMIAIGLGNSGVGQFEIVYMNQLGAKEGLLGIAGMASSAVEIPCMLWADRLVRKNGARGLLMTAMWMYVALRGLVFLYPSVASIIAERAVGGIAFSFYTVALVRFLSEHSAQEERGTVMALFTVTLANLIGIVATPLAGAAFDHVGGHWLYTFAMCGYVLGWLSLRFLGDLRRAIKPAPGVKVE